MDATEQIRIRKFLARHLRHDPAGIGIRLNSAGWCNVGDLFHAFSAQGLTLSRADLEAIVQTDPKNRFEWGKDNVWTNNDVIRARTGHTVRVEKTLCPAYSYASLFHGTGAENLPTIQAEGLQAPRGRFVSFWNHVETAYQIALQYGEPLVLAVDTTGAWRAGIQFYRTTKGEYLADAVPPQFLVVVDGA